MADIKEFWKQNFAGRALFGLRSHLILWIVFVIGFAVDFLTKKWVLRELGVPGQDKPVVIIEDWFRFSTVFNPGAVWGSFGHKTSFLLLVSFVAVVFILCIFASSTKKAWWVHLSCGMILAGAFGNIYDRIFNDGYVIDFIEVNLHFWPANPWPTFNIADSLLCVGVPILVIPMLLSDLKASKKKEAAAADTENSVESNM